MEEAYRKSVFADNLEFILKHNQEYLAGRKTFTMGVNNFADMTNAEFRARFNGFRPSAGLAQSQDFNKNAYNASASVDLPDTVDWVKKGLVTPVKNQGNVWVFTVNFVCNFFLFKLNTFIQQTSGLCGCW